MTASLAALRRHARSEHGIGIVLVMIFLLVALLVTTASFAVVISEQHGAGRQRNVTSARQAAEAGVEQMAFELGQTNNGASNWSSYPTTYGSTGSWPCPLINADDNPDSCPDQRKVGEGYFSGYVTPDAVYNNPNYLDIHMTGYYRGNSRSLRVVVQRTPPQALDYAMFADAPGIEVHHHNQSWLSPTIATTNVHSNGYIKLEYSSQFRVNRMEAVGNLSFDAGGGKLPDGSAIPAAGYNWLDPLTNVCYPGAYLASGSPAQCSTAQTYSGNATVQGTVYAGSVTLGAHGNTLPGAASTTVTGQPLDATGGDVYSGSANLNGTSYPATSGGSPVTYTSATCPRCGKGAAAGGGQLGGNLTILPPGSKLLPQVVPFPSIDYSSTYRVRAQSEQSTSGRTHVFSSASSFLSYVTDPANGFYRTLGSDGTLGTWQKGAAGTPSVIFLDGDWDILPGGGDLTLDWADLLSRAKAGTGLSLQQPPTIVVRGSLIDETGKITLHAPLVVVGRGNRVDFLQPGPSGPTMNVTRLLDPSATEPGMLASGATGDGAITAEDYDQDFGGKNGAAQSYEPLKVNPIYVRGLVYTGTWNASTNSSTASGQHWHNLDPKNLMVLFGAQVGGHLHDCNNFSFTYDPIVKLGFGITAPGAIQTIDWQEIKG